MPPPPQMPAAPEVFLLIYQLLQMPYPSCWLFQMPPPPQLTVTLGAASSAAAGCSRCPLLPICRLLQMPLLYPNPGYSRYPVLPNFRYSGYPSSPAAGHYRCPRPYLPATPHTLSSLSAGYFERLSSAAGYFERLSFSAAGRAAVRYGSSPSSCAPMTATSAQATRPPVVTRCR